MKSKKRSFSKILSFLAILLIMLFVVACGGNESQPSSGSTEKNNESENKSAEKDSATITTKNISIGTTPVGVSYNSIGTGLAKVISTNSDVKIAVKPSNGISAWGPQLNKGEIQLGVGSGPDLSWAFNGENGYERTENMRLLVRGNYLSVTGAAVRDSSEIQSIADLKGKKVAADYPGSAIAKMILQAALTVNGLSWDDVNQVPIPTTAAGIEALQDNQVEAAFALTPTTPVVQEVHNAVGLRSIPLLDNVSPDEVESISQDVIDEVTSIVPGVRFTVVKENGYISEDQIGVEYPAQMVATSFLADDTVYEIMETLWANYEDLAPIHDWLKSWTPENMFDPDPVLPYHPGSIQFFKDKGLWNDEVEEKQQELLKMAE